MEEDEACFNQVSYALQSKFGSGVEIVRAKRKTCMENFEYLLFQVVMQREETDSENDPWHNKFYENEHGLYTHAYKGHSGPEFDSEWLHCILLCTKTRQFFCHNIGKWVDLKHLDLQKDPKTGAVATSGRGYIRTIERVYGLNSVMKSSRPKRGNTVGKPVERLVKRLRENDPTLGILNTKLFGAAMFMDRDHFGRQKNNARSRTAVEMVTDANQLIANKQTYASWEPYKLFSPDEPFCSEIRDFEGETLGRHRDASSREEAPLP